MDGVYGKTDSVTGGAGVMGEGGAASGPGVIGKSQIWHGVYDEIVSNTGGVGVWGEYHACGNGLSGSAPAALVSTAKAVANGNT